MVKQQFYTIGMVDDDSDEAEILQEAINENNFPFRLQYFSSFPDFLAAFEGSQALPDLVVMDINMPCQNGLQCIKELKSHHTLAYIPVVTFSNAHSHTKEAESLGAGAKQLFVKPASILEYKKVLADFYKICSNNNASEFEKQAVA
jgi:DNA-binding response OmpR family regulator